ncbi:MAG: ABC transporter permease, partial [Caldanaerobacter subterraneus]|nr:ABC transporter permease [Caldanaerobacter subterraneus]
VPGQMADVITGLIVFFVAAHRIAEVIKDLLARRQKKEVKA